MKKWLVIVGVLMMAIFMSACSKNWWEDSGVAGSAVSLDDIFWKESLTVQDLDTIDKLLLPSWYSYKTYQLSDWSISDIGNYTYSVDGGSLLLPVHDWMISREIVSSETQSGMIYTMVNVVLSGDETVPVLYINDADTLKYEFASVYWKKETILYTFSY